jgi:hypothetical protein
VAIEVNQHLVNSFLGHSVAEVYKEKGDTGGAMKMYDMVKVTKTQCMRQIII